MAWRISYGMNYRHSTPGTIPFDLRERRLFHVDTKYNAFVEKNLFTNTTLRMDAMFRRN